MTITRARSRAQSSTPRMQQSTRSIYAPRIYCMHHTLQTPCPRTQMHHITPHLHHATHTLHIRPTPNQHHTYTAHAPLHHATHTTHIHHNAHTPHRAYTTLAPQRMRQRATSHHTQAHHTTPTHTNAHHTYAHNTTPDHTALDHTAPENHRAHGDCRSRTRIRRRADQAHSP